MNEASSVTVHRQAIQHRACAACRQQHLACSGALAGRACDRCARHERKCLYTYPEKAPHPRRSSKLQNGWIQATRSVHGTTTPATVDSTTTTDAGSFSVWRYAVTHTSEPNPELAVIPSPFTPSIDTTAEGTPPASADEVFAAPPSITLCPPAMPSPVAQLPACQSCFQADQAHYASFAQCGHMFCRLCVVRQIISPEPRCSVCQRPVDAVVLNRATWVPDFPLTL